MYCSLDALHKDAYDAFKTCRDIAAVIRQITEKNNQPTTKKAALNIEVKLLTPVSPMLVMVF